MQEKVIKAVYIYMDPSEYCSTLYLYAIPFITSDNFVALDFGVYEKGYIALIRRLSKPVDAKVICRVDWFESDIIPKKEIKDAIKEITEEVGKLESKYQLLKLQAEVEKDFEEVKPKETIVVDKKEYDWLKFFEKDAFEKLIEIKEKKNKLHICFTPFDLTLEVYKGGLDFITIGINTANLYFKFDTGQVLEIYITSNEFMFYEVDDLPEDAKFVCEISFKGTIINFGHD